MVTERGGASALRAEITDQGVYVEEFKNHTFRNVVGKIIASSKEDRERQRHAALIFIPFIFFVAYLSAVAYHAHDDPYGCGGSFIALCSFTLIIAFSAQTTWVQNFGVMCTIGLCGGAALGFYLYMRYTIFFFGYRDLRSFTNVLASQQPEQFGDAGMLQFSHSTHVDSSRAVGYKSFENGGKVFCLAPIIDSQMTPADTVSFWAVGEDCCAKRESFQCNDAETPAVHSAVVVIDDDLFVPTELTAYKVVENPQPQYEKAIKLGAHAYKMKSNKDQEGNSRNVFVRWVKDPHGYVRSKYFTTVEQQTGWYIALAFIGFAYSGSRKSMLKRKMLKGE